MKTYKSNKQPSRAKKGDKWIKIVEHTYIYDGRKWNRNIRLNFKNPIISVVSMNANSEEIEVSFNMESGFKIYRPKE